MRNAWLILPYRFLIYPFLLLTIRSLSFLHPKLARYFAVRKKSYWQDHKDLEGAIWIHCSSGELEYAKPIIRYIKESSKEKIFVTYFSPSVESNLKSLQEIDAFMPAPFDKRSDLKKFIRYLKPKALFIARTDIWPEMLFQAKKHKVTVKLFSATLADKNKKLATKLHRYIFSSLISWLDAIYCVDEEDYNNFQRLGAKNIYISGDSRYIQALYRLEKISQPNWPEPQKPLIVFGSTWPEDENQILPAIKAIQKLGYNCILVPHEVDKVHMKALKEKLKEQRLSYCFYSKAQDPLNKELLVVNRVGILANLYLYADLSFVGGSFKKNVHSVMEPLAAGSFVMVGPHNYNNREAQVFKKITIGDITVVKEVDGIIAFCEWTNHFKKHFKSHYKEQIKEEVKSRANFAAKNIPLLLSDLRH